MTKSSEQLAQTGQTGHRLREDKVIDLKIHGPLDMMG